MSDPFDELLKEYGVDPLPANEDSRVVANKLYNDARSSGANHTTALELAEASVPSSSVTLYDQDGSAFPLDGAKATQAFANNEFRLGDDEEYAYQLPDGTIGKIKGKDFSGALEQGATLISPLQYEANAERYRVAQSKQEAQEGIAGAVQAFGLSALEGLTLGTVPLDADMRAIQAAQPAASLVGGLVGSLPAGLGVGAIERGLVGAGAKLATRLGVGAAAGAAEGSAIGAIQELTQNPEATAETLLASAGRGALLGGVLNAGGGLLGEAVDRTSGFIGRKFQKALTPEAVAEVVEQSTGVKLATPIANLYAKVAGLAAGSDDVAKATRTFLSSTPEGRAAREVLKRGDDIYEDGARLMRASADDAMQNTRLILSEAVGEAKASRMAKLAKAEDFDLTARSAVDALQQTKAFFNEVASQSDRISGFARGASKGLLNTEAAEQAVKEAIDSGDVATIFNSLDQLKRRVGKDIARMDKKSEWFTEAKAWYDGLKDHLEDTRLYGDAAVAQKEVNQQWAEYLSNIDTFSRNFMTPVGKAEFQWEHTFDPAKAARFLRSHGTAAADIPEEVLAKHFTSQGKLVESISKYYDLDDSLQKSLQATRKASNDFSKQVTQTVEQAKILNQFKMLEQSGRDAVVIPLLAGAVNPAAGGALAVGMSAAMNPARVVRAASQLRDFTAGFEQGVRRWVKKAVEPMEAARRAVGTGADILYKSGIRGAARQTVVRSALYEDRKRKLEKDQKDHDRVGYSISGFDPRLAAAAKAQVQRADAFLSSKLPQPPRHDLFAHTKPDRTTDAAKDKFLRYARAVDTPLTVLEDLRDGVLTREAVEAIQSVYPSLYQRVRQEVMTNIADSSQLLPYEKLLQLGILLGVPATPALANVAVHQQAYQSALAGLMPDQMMQRQATVSLSKDMMTDTESVLTR